MRSNWQIKEIVDPANGKVERIYKYKGKRCKRIVLDSPIARQLAGYVLIEKDLRSAGKWLAEVDRLRGDDKELDAQGHWRYSKDRSRYDLIKGLFVAALTFYGKAFSQCEGRRVTLNRRQLDKAFHTAHDDAISYRNNFAAHSGAKLLEFAEVALVLPPKKTVLPNLYREMTQPDYYSTTDEDKSFAKLIEHARSISLRKLDELQTKILREEVLIKNYDFWKKQ